MSKHALLPSESGETHNPTRDAAPEEDTSGPFSSEINSVLTESFGQSLDGISVERNQGASARAIDAHAYTMGSTISLGDHIKEDMSDARSMEIISHEVAHALGASSNTGTRDLDGGKESAGEADAHRASSSFRDFIGRGAQGPAPSLSVAHGGDAQIHRFEAGEHANAVDSAADELNLAPDDPRRKLIEQKITLGKGDNAVSGVSQGEITAMMGDFYGVYKTGPDGKEHFDPLASFKAMQDAPKEEKEAILAKVRDEQKRVEYAKTHDGKNPDGTPWEATPNDQLEDITSNRHRHDITDPKTGVTTSSGFSFMDLAQKNSNHFNGASEKNADGTYNPDNNMGSFAILHQAALEAAQKAADAKPGSQEEKDAKEEALALEASSQHFETDRFSAGHQFDKAQLLADNGGGKVANLRARIEHDKYNAGGDEDENGERKGVDLHIAGQDDKSWKAMGDSHWADNNNADNRKHTADATVSSYGDINDILNGKKRADGIDPMATANTKVPQWDPAFNDKVQKEAKDCITPESLWAQKDEIPLLPTMVKTAIKQKINGMEDEEGVDNIWDLVKAKGNHLMDWVEEKGSQGLDWAEKKGAQGLAWAEEKGGQALDWAEKKGGEAFDYVASGKAVDDMEKKGGEALDWAEKKGGEALDAGGKAVDWAEKKGAEGIDWAEKKGGELLETGGKAVDYVTSGKAIDDVEKKGGEAMNWAGEKVNEAGSAISTGAGKAWDATTSAVSDAGSWAGDKADAAKKAFSHLFD